MLMLRMLTLATLLSLPPHALADDHDEEEASTKDGTAHGTLRQLRPYEALICAYSWPCEQALRVAQCESSMNPRAYSAGNRGWFQIHGPSHAHRVGGNLEALYDPAVNTRVAHEIWREQGWRPWPACGTRNR
jgi:hypothetical protein